MLAVLPGRQHQQGDRDLAFNVHAMKQSNNYMFYLSPAKPTDQVQLQQVLSLRTLFAWPADGVLVRHWTSYHAKATNLLSDA